MRNVTIKPWDGMDNSIIISGSLDSEARKLIYKYTSPSFEGGVNDLWHYNIYKDDILFLGIQDFSVCLLENHAGVLELLKNIGVDPQTLED
ncbi:hypothetical protein [Robertmurraya kyonggiensis]|uniref:Uncharacterized protein n=1 Tax=Robertmurraya kyonggiensis TaxID=1037680 RepID=A0A4U1CYV4_9BACI|nr:hypothetical protein [Robertmurraya kyonggiensis]TKC15205.1 hypothetical protein FA727_20195 [Robertmurraya kyonggiensis]